MQEHRDFIHHLDFAAAYWDAQRVLDTANPAWLRDTGLSECIQADTLAKFNNKKLVQIVLTPQSLLTVMPIIKRVNGVLQCAGFYTWCNAPASALSSSHAAIMKKLCDTTPIGWTYLDPTGRHVYANQTVLTLLQLTDVQLNGKHYQDLVFTSEFRHRVTPMVERALRGQAGTFLVNLTHPFTGKTIALQAYATPDVDLNQTVLGVSFIIVDIEQQRIAEVAHQRSSQWIEESFKNNLMAIIECDKHLRILHWAGRAQAMFGFTTEQALGRPVFELIRAADSTISDTREAVLEALRTNTVQTFHHRNVKLTQSGRKIHCQWYNSVYINPETKQAQFMSLAVDVTQEALVQAQLKELSNTDVLTGLLNRTGLNEAIETCDLTQPHTLMFLDLDGFKAVNDTFGHVTGDRLLVKVANRLKTLLAPGDVIARQGGDEFVFKSANLTTHAQADAFARQLLALFETPFYIEYVAHYITTSIGVAMTPDHATEGVPLLQAADIALYRAKAQGKNRHHHYTLDMGIALKKRTDLIEELRLAIQSRALDVYFQPQHDVATGALMGCEALVRWKKNGQYYCPPDVFIPLAEETGLINPLWQFVLEQACAFAVMLNRDSERLLTVSVNLSPVQLKNDQFVLDIRLHMQLSGCPIGALHIEVTETHEIANQHNIALLTVLRDSLGVTCSIDDFGMGFSNLSRLRTLPISTLKIDRSFISELDTVGSSMVEAMIVLAHRLGLTVVAEGVENQTQLDTLSALGCDAFQGFIRSGAVPADVLLAQLVLT